MLTWTSVRRQDAGWEPSIVPPDCSPKDRQERLIAG
jgi:hypothetical protein